MLILNFHRDIKYLFRSIISNIFMSFSSLICSHCSLISFISFIDSRKQFSNKKFEKNSEKTERVLLSNAPKITFWFISFPNVFSYYVYTPSTHTDTYLCMCVYVFKMDCNFFLLCAYFIF